MRYKGILEFSRELLGVLLVFVLVQTFCFMKTEVPSGSMIPTINEGDHFIVNFFPMYYREPQMGEIVVFKEDGERMIKRVIAGPGQEIDLIEGYVYVDDIQLDESTYLMNNGATFPYHYSQEPIVYPYVVPEDHYFMMGDNRTGSRDSRDYGPVNRNQMISTSGIRIYPFDAIGKLE